VGNPVGSAGFAVRVANQAVVLDAINKLKGQASDPYLMAKIGVALVGRVHDCFRESKDPGGTAWAPLKFQRLRDRGDAKGKPLLDTGRLRRSINFAVIGAGKIRVGTNVRYAATHQFGDPNRVPSDAPRLVFRVRVGPGKVKTIRAKKVSIPARPFLPTTKSLPYGWAKEIDEIVGRHIGEFIKAAAAKKKKGA
jgi:phage gpG-like protein